jgi:uncharacterized protein (TIGR00369 family)
MDDEILIELRDLLDRSAFHSWVGISVVNATAGDVLVGFDAEAEHLNLQGLIHGGLLATLADTAMGLAVRTRVEAGRRHVTIELGVHYLRSGKPGRIEARGRAVRVGTETAYTEADVIDGTGRLLARAHGTYSVTSLPAL